MSAPSSASASLEGSNPERAATVALANQKGGVGKTTTAVNTAVILASAGYRILLVDLDPQGNATSSLGIDKADLLYTSYDVLVDALPLGQAVAVTDRRNLDLVPATANLAGAEVDLVPLSRREQRLANALQSVKERYQLILIDCPPSLGLLTVNGLTAADSVVIPIQCEFLALEGVSQLVTTIDLVRRGLNPTLEILGVLLTMYDGRTRLSTHVVQEVRQFFGEKVFDAIIPRSIRLAEAPSFGQAIPEYDASSRGAIAYRQFVEELKGRLGLPAPVSPTAATMRSSQPTGISGS
ncbi:MAG TPA: AAA family ATPase [Thermomicrobiales bacterium]|nr:AAA family ATPase [Thermomicrobiales bacterium]